MQNLADDRGEVRAEGTATSNIFNVSYYYYFASTFFVYVSIYFVKFILFCPFCTHSFSFNT
jgi:hypothetical protein